MPEPVVTISAAYGAGGSLVAPALAGRLGWPFIDRMITAAVSSDAEGYEGRSGEGLSEGEASSTPPGRLLASLARAAGAGVMMAPLPELQTDVELRERTESALRPVVAGGAAVVLGRAAAVVLADRPRTLHVRLQGPAELRMARAAEMDHVDAATARARLARTDRSRNLFVRRLYRRDPEDSSLYHLVLDTTLFTVEDVVTLLLGVVRTTIAADRAAGGVEPTC